MKEKELTNWDYRESNVYRPELGYFYQEKGAYDGKLFHSKHKVTYTFLDDQEVVSLHFDKVRGEIFIKGHSLENYFLSDKEWSFFDQFRFVILSNGLDEFIKSFDDSINFYRLKSA